GLAASLQPNRGCFREFKCEVVERRRRATLQFQLYFTDWFAGVIIGSNDAAAIDRRFDAGPRGGGKLNRAPVDLRAEKRDQTLGNIRIEKCPGFGGVRVRSCAGDLIFPLVAGERRNIRLWPRFDRLDEAALLLAYAQR